MDITFLGALSHRSFRFLLASHAFATVAQLALVLGVGVEALARTDSAVWLSVSSALGLLPYVLFSGVAGAVADRYARSAVLAVSAGLRVAVSGAVALIISSNLPVGYLVAASAVSAVLGTVSYPAIAAATPEVVPNLQLPPANALVTSVENVAWIVGPGLLGVLLLTGMDVGGVSLVAAGLFGVASALAIRAPLPRPAQGGSEGPSSVWDEVSAGARLVARDGRVRAPMIVAVLDNFLYGVVVVGAVLVGRDALNGGDTGAGWLNAGLAAGAVGSMVVVNRILVRGKPVTVLIVSLSMTAGAVAVLGSVESITAAFCVVVIAGLGCLLAEVAAVTYLQRAAPSEVTARVFGVYDTLNVGAIAVGSGIVGPLSEAVGIDAALFASGALVLVLAALCIPTLRRHAQVTFEATDTG